MPQGPQRREADVVERQEHAGDRARAKHWAEESLDLPYAIRQRTSAARQVRMLDWTAALEFMLVAAMRSEHDVPFQRVHDFLEVAGDLLPQVDLLDVRVGPETRHLFWRVGDDPWEGTDSPHQYRSPRWSTWSRWFVTG